MKVKAQYEALSHIKRRRAFRWMGSRGMKSKTAEGTYGVFIRQGMPGHNFNVTTILAVYEPKTATWYSDMGLLHMMHTSRIDLPAEQKRNMNCSRLDLNELYKGGYPVLAQARIRNEL